MMSVTGYPDSPPVKVSIPLADLSAGLFAANGVLAAYIHRLKTGEGQVIDTSLLEAAIALTVWEAAEYWGSGVVPGPEGLGAPARRPLPGDGERRRLLQHRRGEPGQLRAPLRRPRTPRPADRPPLRHEPGPRPPLRGARRGDTAHDAHRTSAEWLAVFEAAGVPAGPIYGMDEVFANEHVVARGMIVAAGAPGRGCHQQPRHPGQDVGDARPGADARPHPRPAHRERAAAVRGSGGGDGSHSAASSSRESGNPQ